MFQRQRARPTWLCLALAMTAFDCNLLGGDGDYAVLGASSDLPIGSRSDGDAAAQVATADDAPARIATPDAAATHPSSGSDAAGAPQRDAAATDAFTGLPETVSDAASDKPTTPRSNLPVDASGDAPAGPRVDASDAGLACTSCVEAYSRRSGTPDVSAELQVPLQLRNMGVLPIKMSSITVRYYFSADACPLAGLAGRCDASQLDNLNVACPAARVVALPVPKSTANAYVEFTWAGKDVLNPSTTADYQTWGAIYQPDHLCTFQQSNDYSYVPTTDFALVHTVTVHIGGKLVWGKEP